jgi:outer membrane protein TolC
MHRFIRSLVVIAPAIVCLCLPARAQSSGNDQFPLPENYFPALKDLIDTAAKQSPRVIARNTENAVAEANRISARSGQLPSLGGYYSFYPWTRDLRADLPESTGVKKTAYNLSITQPLFHWGALRDNTRIGELQKRITEGQSAEAFRLLVDEIRAQYLQIIVNKSALARSRFNQTIADDQLALARSKLEKKVIAEADMFAPTITAEQARLAADRAADDYENSRVYLGKLCGLPPIPDEQIPTEVPAVTPASSALQSVTAEFAGQTEINNYSLQNVRDQIETEKLNYHVANTRLRPKVNLVVGTSQDEQNYALNSVKYKVQSYFAGVTVNWSIFDGFATRSAKQVSLARRRQLELSYRDQTADTIAAVKTQMRQLEFAARNLAIVERLLGSAGDNLKARKDDMARGIASDAEVNTAQLGLYDWQLAAYGARNDYMMKVSKLLSATMKDPALQNLPSQRR